MWGRLRNQRKGMPYTVDLGQLSTLPLKELSNYLHDESMMNQKELQVERTAFSNCTEQLDLVLFETHTEILENVQKRYQNRHCSWDNGTSPFYLGWILLNGKNSQILSLAQWQVPLKAQPLSKCQLLSLRLEDPKGMPLSKRGRVDEKLYQHLWCHNLPGGQYSVRFRSMKKNVPHIDLIVSSS